MPAKAFWKGFSKLNSRRNPATFDLDNLSFSEWHCCLVEAVQHGRETTDIFDSSNAHNMFHIKGRGFDTHDVCSILGHCLFKDVSDQHGDNNMQSSSFDSSSDMEDIIPVLWSIGHTAVITEKLVVLLEELFPGLHFLCSCDSDELDISTQDSDMWKLMDMLCQHPFSDEEDGCNTAIIGIDFASLSSSIISRASSPPPSNWLSYLRPVRSRLNAFSGVMSDVLYEYQSYKLSQKNHEMDMNTNRNLGLTESNLKVLDDKYLNCPVKIVDLGNACWTYKHFTDDIQTRQYRAPEVIIGAKYGPSADMWSLACIVFELLTGDLLFDPHAGKTWDRDEDHLAMIAELLGGFPKRCALSGKRSSQYFHKSGDFRHIHHLKVWHLVDVLRDKYLFASEDAEAVADFLTDLLEVKCLLIYINT
jgi:hypothetical protein